MKNNKRKLLAAVFGIIGVLLAATGVTVAWFSYSKSGTKENSISSGSITFHYEEGDGRISVQDMMPMTDEQGMAQEKYFEFDITSKTSRTVDIPYYITVRRTDESFADLDSAIKVYLTKVDNGVESQVALSKYSILSHYENDEINIPLTEKALYNDTVLAGASNYTQKYRLRMWIDTSANYLVQTPVAAYCERNSDHQTVTTIDSSDATVSNCVGPDYTWHPADVTNSYPLNNKTYTLKVNVYSTGNDIGEDAKALRENTNISSMSIGPTGITTVDGENYSTTIEVVDIENIPTSITVETEGPGATVTATKVNTTGALIEDNKIKRLSSTVNVPLPGLEIGTNNYIITVISADKSKTDTYNLTVIVGIKQPESFANDDWTTIVNTVKSGNGSVYAPKTGGKENQPIRAVNMGSLGTHYLRVANTTSCEDARLENPNLTSETGCGFVIEFADIVDLQQMGTAKSSLGGYPGTNVMFNYVTVTLYNALPDYIKNVIIPTTVVSSHETNDTATGTGRDQNSNYVTPNQQIYLLDTKEVFNDQGTGYANSASSTTRQLDYYKLNNTQDDRKKQYNGLNESWWLRSVHPSYSPNFLMVFSSDGKANSGPNTASYGVSPAFRIG